jgi:hypothetical protein
LVLGLWRLQVACQKVQKSVEKVQETMSAKVAAETASKVQKRAYSATQFQVVKLSTKEKAAYYSKRAINAQHKIEHP